MSDFLADILRRHDAPKDSLRPRLPSLFETGAPAATRHEEPMALEQDVEIEAAPATPRRTPPPAQEPPQAAVGPVAPRDAPQAVQGAAVRTLPEMAQPPFAPSRESPVPSAPAARIVGHASEPPAPVRPVPRNVPDESFVSKREPASTVAREPARAPALAANSTHTIEVREVSAARETPMPAAIVPKPAEAPFAMPPAPRRQEPAREMREAETQEPVIHVSIGRIEIRASEERESRPRKNEPRAPVMTLEDYLKSRARR